MIELRGSPAARVMAILARRRETGCLMIRVAGVIVIGLMAEHTLRGRALILSIHVALRTGNTDVCAGQREVRLIVIKRRRAPTGCRVTDRAIVIVLPLHMVGIRHTVVIILMTRPAVGRRSLILTIHMTGDTAHAGVRSGQRELRLAVIER